MKAQISCASFWALSALAAIPFEQQRPSAQQTWTKVSRAPEDAFIHLSVVLTPAKPGLIEQHSVAISDPSNSERWRQHFSAGEVTDALAPRPDDEEPVFAWLRSSGGDPWRGPGKLEVRCTIGQAENLLSTTYGVYQHTSGQKAMRTDSYYVPEDLQESVQFIAPTVQFPLLETPLDADLLHRRDGLPVAGQLTARAGNSRLQEACLNGTSTLVTPDCFHAVYDIDYNPKSPNTSFGIIGINGGFNATDLAAFLSLYNPPAAAAKATFIETIDPSLDPDTLTATNQETAIDTQTSLGLAYPIPAILYSLNTTGALGHLGSATSAEADAAGQDRFLQFLTELAHNETVTDVVSFSAGANEDYVPVSYARHVCTLIAAIGARGTTFVASSGDEGPISAGRTNHHTPIDPQFPASCPYVLAVGATADPFDEVAATQSTAGFTSGGGFSNLYARPSWQDEQVSSYIKTFVDAGFQAMRGFNTTGRGYPDVAALGYQLPLVLNGAVSDGASGTSASAPAWAAMIALLNAYEVDKGRPTLGFVNPWLYEVAAGGKGFRDIVKGDGSDFIAIGEGPLPRRGYNASVGWDALTGLGVPVFEALRAELDSMAERR